MSHKIAYLLLVGGLAMLVVGLIGGGFAQFTPAWASILVAAGLVLAGARMLHGARRWKQEIEVRRTFGKVSPLAARLIPQLQGEYSPYVIEAARDLGAARDVTAVPAIMHVLENCVDMQRPGWRDVAETLVQALAQIGDRRALPLLYRLENVRGIGLIGAIRSGISSIEPQTSLLRPGNADALPAEALLRPARYGGSEETELLHTLQVKHARDSEEHTLRERS